MKKAWHKQIQRVSKERRTTKDGITHDSLAEATRWILLLDDLKAGRITDLKRQVRHPLVLSNGVAVRTPKGRVAVYTSDFEYIKNGKWVVEDVKGYRDRESALRIAIFSAIYNVNVNIIKV